MPPDQTATPTEAEEFDAAYEEIVAGKADPAKGDKPAGGESDPKTAEPKTPEQTTNAPADKPAEGGDKPAADKAAEAVKAEPVKPAADPAKQAADLDRQLAEALHRERSVAGRIGIVERQNNELKGQLATAQAEIASLKAKATAPSARQSGEASKVDDALTRAPDLEQAILARIDAAVAPYKEALEKQGVRLDEVAGTVTKAAESIEPLSEAEHRRNMALVAVDLDKAFGAGWRGEVKTSRFAAWLKKQTPTIQDLYTYADTFDSSSTVLRMYAADTGVQLKPAAQGAQPNAAAPNADPKANLRRSTTLAPSSGARPASKQEDFEGSFDEFSAALQRSKAKQVTHAQQLR